jgi:hypothetical protein
MINHIIVNKLYDEGLRRHAHERALSGRRSVRLQGWRLQRLRREPPTPTTPRPGDTSSTRRDTRGSPRASTIRTACSRG